MAEAGEEAEESPTRTAHAWLSLGGLHSSLLSRATFSGFSPVQSRL